MTPEQQRTYSEIYARFYLLADERAAAHVAGDAQRVAELGVEMAELDARGKTLHDAGVQELVFALAETEAPATAVAPPLAVEVEALPTVVAAAFDRSSVYDPETRDYAMYLDGELVGFARTGREAEETLDALVYELLTMAYGPLPQAA